jgi:selenocysteine lyase/cysteine desulfurase
MPEVYGGGTVQIVADSRQEYKNPPESWEAGSPNYPGIVGLSKAIDILQEVGFDKIEEHERVLNRKLIDGLKKFDNIIIYGDSEKIDDRVGVVTFDFSDLNSYYLAVALKEYGGVGTRRGSFCAHTYVWRLKGISDDQVGGFENCEAAHSPGMIRISFGIYNTEEEVDRFLEVLPKAIEEAKKEVETVTKEGKVVKPIDPTY